MRDEANSNEPLPEGEPSETHGVKPNDQRNMHDPIHSMRHMAYGRVQAWRGLANA